MLEMKARLINLTPHMINIICESGTISVPACGDVARVSATKELVNTLSIENVSVPIYTTTFGDVEVISPDGSKKLFPEPEKNVLYIVSNIVKSALSDRNDVVVPADLVRDENGNIVGCRGLST